jgi:transcriptional regulator with XRE-family HTH domain
MNMKYRAPVLQEHPLKDALRKQGLTQAQAAQMLGVSLSTLAAYLCGYREPPPHVQKKLESLRRHLLTTR